MKTRLSLVHAAASAAVLCFSGCASIVSGRYADVQLDSHPSNAHVVIRDHQGIEVATANTPAVVSLKRNRKFFLPARYTASFESPGYKTAMVPLRSTINPWVTGNIVLGGPIGLVVDTATGAGWKPRHDQISQHLTPMDSAGLSDGTEQKPPYVAERTSPEPGVEPASGTY